MRFLHGLLVLVLPLAIAAAPVPTHIMPKDDPVCYPLRVGDRSVFQAGEHEIVYTVTKVEKVESGTRVTNEVFYGEQKITRISIVIVSPRGVQHVEDPRTEARPADLVAQTSTRVQVDGNVADGLEVRV